MSSTSKKSSSPRTTRSSVSSKLKKRKSDETLSDDDNDDTEAVVSNRPTQARASSQKANKKKRSVKDDDDVDEDSAKDESTSTSKSKSKSKSKSDLKSKSESKSKSKSKSKKSTKSSKADDDDAEDNKDDDDDDNDDEGDGDEEESKKGKGKSKGKTPKTLKDQILHIVQNSDTLSSLQNIKSKLDKDYGHTLTAAFNKRISRTLSSLVSSSRSDFSQYRGSYYGGESSRAGRALIKEVAQKTKEAETKERRKRLGLIVCPWCEGECDDSCFVDEDSIARGGIYRCSHKGCKKTFYTWISDGCEIGRKVEYKFSGEA